MPFQSKQMHMICLIIQFNSIQLYLRVEKGLRGVERRTQASEMVGTLLATRHPKIGVWTIFEKP